MIYCDTSLVVTALATEPTTSEAQFWLEGHASEPLAASPWVEAELACALAAKERGGLLKASQRVKAFAIWRVLLAGWRVLPVEPRHFVRVTELAELGLRAGDALHLAIASREGAALATRDRDLGEAARTLGMVVHLLA